MTCQTHVQFAWVTDDLDATVEAAVDGRFENTGQACNAAKRIIVAENVYDEFLGKFTEKVLGKAGLGMVWRGNGSGEARTWFTFFFFAAGMMRRPKLLSCFEVLTAR